MALIKSVRGFTPEFGENCFLADNATIIGDVKMGQNCSIWFSTVLRGDVNSIRMGDGVNIQDGSVLHTLYEKSTIEIGNYVSVGHNVTIHGATVKDYALIGMGSTLLDHAVHWRRRNRCRRLTCTEQYHHRIGKYLGRCTGQVHKEGRSGTS